MAEYQANSHRSKELQANENTERKVEKVVTGKVKTKKNVIFILFSIFVFINFLNIFFKQYVIIINKKHTTKFPKILPAYWA